MFSSKNKAVKYLAFHTYQPHPIILYIPLYEYMWYLLFRILGVRYISNFRNNGFEKQRVLSQY